MGTSNPATRLSNVLFPQPLGPINAQKSPFATSTVTRSSPVIVSPPTLINFRYLVEAYHRNLLLHSYPRPGSPRESGEKGQTFEIKV